YEGGYSVDMISAFKESAMKKLQEIKKEICQKNKRNFDIECVAEMGFPFDVINTVAQEQKADLIVVGIIGEAGTLKEHLIGSTAIKIARNQDIPTFIIPENIKYRRIHKLAFACDFKKTEETDLIYIAKYFAKIFDAKLEIVNVKQPKEEVTVETAKTNLFIEAKLENVNHKTIHLTGEDVALELEDYLSSNMIDAVLINPKKHNLFYYLFNSSVTKKLAFHAALPIITIH
ncbi:MAG TPA: universal stress protein, partial [Nitrosopumilaceae archaeon]|nr:universal stress protein [Nitrosopumilaceae archaeon]